MKKKIQKFDGLGPLEIKKIRAAVRLVWHRCHARRLVVDRCTRGGWTYCEKCGMRTPKLKIDHIVAVGDLDGDFISRLFCASSGLQGLCKACHDQKTRQERLQARLMRSLNGYLE